ncbi:hypothetical protein [Mesorhizobium sp.]|uniref:hypothetical protein n=1 Tax=Mesorhizobium sp. TaxID=1871066 RepID=UPI000FE5C654|nr:hypothetical protein [Mesorhizobium sp.]RWF66832.1 MAG: hypothetical protein EOS47_04395 [Mesorhizobium sp.]TIT40204.1 MAG: hypothetical protein E5W76_17240 [Mesorhizobium sp.]
MDLLKKLLIVALCAAIAAGTVAIIERLVLEPPRPALTGEPPPLPVIKQKPVRQWKRALI